MYEELMKSIHESSSEVFFNGSLLNEIKETYDRGFLSYDEYDDLLSEYGAVFNGWEEEDFEY